MSPETFLANFGHLADAPNGVQKLRELILQLAVRGRLVPQDPSDEPASVLLDRIEAAKRKFQREGKVSKADADAPVPREQYPHEIPETWLWTRLGTITEIVGGGTPKTTVGEYWSDDGVSWLTPADLSGLQGKYISRGSRDISQLGLESSSARLLPTGSVLLSSRAPIGYVAIAANPLATNQGFKSCVPYVSGMSDYIYYFLKSAAEEIERNAPGTTFKEVSGKIVAQVFVPLPPLAEQQRIVAKVDLLMVLCDKLEAQQQLRTEQRVRLNAAALHRLTTAQDADDLERAWERVREQFDLLYDGPETVGELRQAILQLAVRGKLEPQDPADEPASVLLEKIAAEKRRLERAGKIRRSKPLPPVSPDEVPFEVPAGWEWAYIDNLCDVAGGIQKTPQRRPRANAFPYLRVANVQRGRLGLGEIEYFELFDGELEKWRLEPGDLLVVEGNGSETEIGRCAIWNGEIESCVHQNHLIRCRPIETQLGAFLLRYLNSPAGMAEMKRLAITTSGLYNLSVGKIRGIAVPVPPLAEQQRIVGRVVQLLALCDELESKLTRARTKVEHFASSVVHHLTAA